MRLITALLVCTLGSAAASAAESIELPVMQPLKSAAKPGDFVFHLLPKAFQPNPQLDMTVRCQLTAYGRTIMPATPDHPVYYVSFDAGRKQYGEFVAGESLPDQAYLDKVFTRALSTNGYLPAEGNVQPPTLALIYHWGSFYEMDREDKANFPLQAFQHDMQRAALVGGVVLQNSQIQQQYAEAAGFPRFFSENSEQQYLNYQAAHDLYFAVVSAYDYAALAQGERKLVWRANLTANAQGVAMSETLPPLVLTAGTAFGRDTGGALIVNRNVLRGSVTIGPLIIVQSDVPNPAPREVK